MKVLLRLLPYIKAHKWAFGFGMLGLVVARIFEALIPLYVKQGVLHVMFITQNIQARNHTAKVIITMPLSSSVENLQWYIHGTKSSLGLYKGKFICIFVRSHDVAFSH